MQHSSNEIRGLSQAKKPLREFDCKRFKVCIILCGDSLNLFSGLLTENFSRRSSYISWNIFISLGFDDAVCRLFGREEKTPPYFLITCDACILEEMQYPQSPDWSGRGVRITNIPGSQGWGFATFFRKRKGGAILSSDRRAKLSTNYIDTTNIPPMKGQLSNSVYSNLQLFSLFHIFRLVPHIQLISSTINFLYYLRFCLNFYP